MTNSCIFSTKTQLDSVYAFKIEAFSTSIYLPKFTSLSLN